MEKIIEKEFVEMGENLIKYLDGSSKVKCSVCGEWEEIVSGSKQANLLAQIEGKEKGWKCRKCWLAEKGNEKDTRREEIAFAQAYNLAIQIVKEIELDWREEAEEGKEKIRKWQKWFYEELTKNN